MPLRNRLSTPAPPQLLTPATYRTEGHPALDSILYYEANGIFVNEFKHSCHGTEQADGSKLNALDYLPDGFTILRRSSTIWSSNSLLARCESAVLLIEASANGMTVYAGSNDTHQAEFLVRSILRQLPKPKPVVNTDVKIAVWMLGGDGPYYRNKVITVPTWGEVEHNYPPDVRAHLSEIMTDTKPTDKGKIILWHGIPGTGKTSAIRTLMREWKPWCSFHYVTDPERMFSLPGYLLEVATGGGSSGNGHRLIICEDTGQFLKSDASDQSGAAMGRLLNFSDGILGQGSNVMFLMTTNEDISVLHPAVTRPGRCYKNLEFPAFDQQEAQDWLDDAELPVEASGAMSLAELIAIQKSNSANSLQLDSATV